MVARALDLPEPPPLCGLFRWQQEGLCGQISGVFSGFVDWGLWTGVCGLGFVDFSRSPVAFVYFRKC